MASTAERLENELSELGLDDLIGPDQPDAPAPVVEPEESPPEADDDPVGAEADPAEPPPTTDRERIAQATHALTRALDQLHTHFTEARSAAHALRDALEAEDSREMERVVAPVSASTDDEGISTDEGEQDDEDSVSEEA